MKSKLLLILSLAFILAPLVTIWWMSDYDRYLSLIEGPFPFSYMGSMLYQIVFYSISVLIGSIGLYFFFSRNRENKSEN